MQLKNANVQYGRFPTLRYQYANEEEEYVFCVKGRPFGVLVSPSLPTPSSTLIDYNLIRRLSSSDPVQLLVTDQSKQEG